MSYYRLVSLVKSGARITGYLALLKDIKLGIVVLIISEIFGILEEREE